MDEEPKPVHSDALVLFGVTGELAHKMIFPALDALTKSGALKVPVIGVAASNLSPSQLRNRVTDSIRAHGRITDRPALNHVLSRLAYVSGDNNDPKTFQALKRALGHDGHPAFYLAIPTELFATVITGLVSPV